MHLERGVDDKGRDDFHPVGPEDLQSLLVVLDGVVLVQLPHGFFIDLLKPDEDFPEPGLPEKRDNFRMLYDGVAATLES